MEKGNRSEESNFDVAVTPSPTNPASLDSIENDDGMFLMFFIVIF